MSGGAPGAPRRVDFRAATARALGDVRLQQFVGSATTLKHRGRVESLHAAFADRLDGARRQAGRIKQHTLDHLDVYLERFAEAARRAGVVVHAALDGASANDIVVELARRRGCRLCVKSKSMVTEETGLVPALQGAGVETVETDLGEFILQLDGEPPSHIVTPMIHKDRAAVARAFVRELGAEYTEDPPRLTRIARDHLREKFRTAGMGVSGANFLLASTGTVVLCTNEGNGGLSVGSPRLHVVVAGIEKLIPDAAHLPVFLKMLARSSTAQPLTVYTTLLTGPRRAGESDGPEEVHVVLLDNGRTGLLAGESRELLRCIRCGACLNACPVYRRAGGHAYGAVYGGPIGAALTPLLAGLAPYADLPQASSLCGACHAACPVDIDIPRHLVRLRREQVDRRIAGRGERLAMRAWAWLAARPRLYRAAAAAAAGLLRAAAKGDADGTAWVRRGPGPLRHWTGQRPLPAPAAEPFRAWWRSHRRTGGGP